MAENGSGAIRCRAFLDIDEWPIQIEGEFDRGQRSTKFAVPEANFGLTCCSFLSEV